jgi:hypothetical protein
MKDAIDDKLKMLQQEYEAGQKMLAELDARRAALTSTLLRIEGAIQVLKELGGAAAEPPRPNGSEPGGRAD